MDSIGIMGHSQTANWWMRLPCYASPACCLKRWLPVASHIGAIRMKISRDVLPKAQDHPAWRLPRVPVLHCPGRCCHLP